MYDFETATAMKGAVPIGKAIAELGISRATAFRWLASGRLRAAGAGNVDAESIQREQGASRYRSLFREWSRSTVAKRAAVQLWIEVVSENPRRVGDMRFLDPPPPSFLLFCMKSSAAELRLIRAYVRACRLRVLAASIDNNKATLRKARRNIKDAWESAGGDYESSIVSLINTPRYEAIDNGELLKLNADEVSEHRETFRNWREHRPTKLMAYVLGVDVAAIKNRMSRAKKSIPNFPALLSRSHKIAVHLAKTPDQDFWRVAETWCASLLGLEWRESNLSSAMNRADDRTNVELLGYDEKGRVLKGSGDDKE